MSPGAAGTAARDPLSAYPHAKHIGFAPVIASHRGVIVQLIGPRLAANQAAERPNRRHNAFLTFLYLLSRKCRESSH